MVSKLIIFINEDGWLMEKLKRKEELNNKKKIRDDCFHNSLVPQLEVVCV